MIKYILKHISRGIVSNILFCLLLGLAGALLCISAGLWFSSYFAIRDLDDTITTIAMPDPFHIERFTEENEISFTEVIQTIRSDIYGSGSVKQDERRIYNAVAEGITPIPLRATGLGMEANIVAYSSQPFAAFVLTCEKLDTTHRFINAWDEETGEYIPYIQRIHFATFYIEDVLFLHEDYARPWYVTIEFSLNPDGSAPFELRKQYIAMGMYVPGGGFAGGFSSLTLDVRDVPAEQNRAETVTTSEQLSLLFPRMDIRQITERLPYEVREFVLQRNIDINNGEYGFIEIPGITDADVQEAMASPQQVWMREALEDADISSRSFQVLTTNDPLSMLRLNQRRNLFEEGRTFTAKELKDGEHVCLVSRAFAERNELTVGDVIPLEMYAAVIGTTSISYIPSEEASMTTHSIWMPSLYHHGLEITEPAEYTIVGIMNLMSSDPSNYAIPRNFVMIPGNSFDGVAGEPVSRLPVPDFVPLLDDGFIIPNGRVDETRAVIDSIAPGYGSLFRVYDQGYGSVKKALDNLQFGLSWILGLSFAVWLAIAYLFSFFFTARKRREAAVLNAAGMSRASRFLWIFVQSTIPVIFSLAISLAVTLPLYEYIIEAAAEITEAFTDSFRNLTLSDAADSGIRRRIPLGSSPAAMIYSAVAGTAVLLAVTGFMSAKAAVFETLSSGKGDD